MSPVEHEDRTGCTACVSGDEARAHEACIAEIAACRAAFESGGRGAVSRLLGGGESEEVPMTSAERTRLIEAVAVVSAYGAELALEGRDTHDQADIDAAYERLVERMGGDTPELQIWAHEHADSLEDALVIGMDLTRIRMPSMPTAQQFVDAVRAIKRSA
ncbi:MAG: hypothetical protein IT379_37325 [Deltaproteobacteria bacterium]|nr:hypothetical protein [Deltaproteobacteria bacterium]